MTCGMKQLLAALVELCRDIVFDKSALVFHEHFLYFDAGGLHFQQDIPESFCHRPVIWLKGWANESIGQRSC